MKHVVISPGHYSSFKGVSKNGFNEFDEVEKIVSFLGPKLAKEGLKVTVVTGKLIDKVNKINELNPDLAIEVHLGNTNNTKTSGSRSFYMVNKQESKDLAQCLLDSCVNELNTRDKGMYVGWYKKITPAMVEKGKAPEDWKTKIDLFISKINCASAIIEPFYISSTDDCEDFITADAHEEVADALQVGILNYIKTIS